MQVESVKTNESLTLVDEDRTPCAVDVQVVQAIREDSEVSSQDGAEGSSAEYVEGVSGVSSGDTGLANLVTGKVQTAVASEGVSGDQAIDTMNGDAAAFLVDDTAKGGETGEGGVGGFGVVVDGGDAVACTDPETYLADNPAKGGKGGEGGVGGLELAAEGGDAVTSTDPATFLADGPAKGGKGGEGGAGIEVMQVPDSGAVGVCVSSQEDSKDNGEGAALKQLTNSKVAEFLRSRLPKDAVLAVCSKPGDPNQGGWIARRADQVDLQCPKHHNNYVNSSSFKVETDGSVKARKENFTGLSFVMIDDIGTKVPRERLAGVVPTWEIETSPGNSQMVFVFETPLTDIKQATRILDDVIGAKLSDPGANGVVRWARMPVAINGKPKYEDKFGYPFECKTLAWNQTKTFTEEQLRNELKLNTKARDILNPTAKPAQSSKSADTVYIPKAAENPVVTALKERGLYKRPLSDGRHEITCPWVGEHTDALDTGAVYIEPSKQSPIGVFRCQHSHGDKHRIRELLEFLGVDIADARHKARIQLAAGEINGIIEAGELVLVERGNYYQAGGLIVSIKVDPKTGDPSILPVSEQALTQELAASADWEKFDGRNKSWVRTDPPPRHVGMLYKAQQYKHLPILQGVTRQPYFREEDGQIVTQPGYDALSHRFGVFDAAGYVLPEPTFEVAQEALAMLREVVCEFHFAHPYDEAAAISAMFTAVLRPSIDLAPGFHAKAHSIGSGKTLLCEVIGAMAGPGGNRKLSYPKTSEEASKVILAALLECPAVIEFDDMDSNWLPHGVINRMLTSTHMTERILGSSKVATVSTRTLILGSGNNVEPIRDLVRRVITITLDPQCATPATLQYRGNPLAMVQKHRAKYVCAVLTIVQAWRLAGSPKTNVPNIASYGGAWSDYCRHPLIWLGLPDPATAIFEQLKNDPDREALGMLMSVWRRHFGEAPTTVRKVVAKANDSSDGFDLGNDSRHDLLDAISEFPVTERGVVNPSKFGWLLKRNANRIVDGFRFEEASADGRKAWRVVAVDAPPSPDLPASNPSDEKTVAPDSAEEF